LLLLPLTEKKMGTDFLGELDALPLFYLNPPDTRAYMLPQPSSHPAINRPPRHWLKRHRRLISRRRAVSASSFTQLTAPLNNSTSYQYDSVGNLTQKTNLNSLKRCH